MTEEELVELPQPAIIIAEQFTIESAYAGIFCLEGKESKDWIYLTNRDRLNWELN